MPPAGAQVIGTDIVANPADAAFANATMGHGLVREDMHVASIGHHGVVVWPVLLALAQRTRSSGSTFLASAVIGYEAAARIGTALFDADLARLFRPTGLASPIGAALGGSRLIGLDEDGAMRALSLAVNAVSGLNQWPHSGAGEMYFHPGFAARNAVTAVELAEAGAHASDDIVEGEAGLIAAFRRKPARADIILFADGRAEILSVFNKPAPACNLRRRRARRRCRSPASWATARRDIVSVSVRVSDAAVRYPGLRLQGTLRAVAAGENEHPVRRRGDPGPRCARGSELRHPGKRRDPPARGRDEPCRRSGVHRRPIPPRKVPRSKRRWPTDPASCGAWTTWWPRARPRSATGSAARPKDAVGESAAQEIERWSTASRAQTTRAAWRPFARRSAARRIGFPQSRERVAP